MRNARITGAVLTLRALVLALAFAPVRDVHSELLKYARDRINADQAEVYKLPRRVARERARSLAMRMIYRRCTRI